MDVKKNNQITSLTKLSKEFSVEFEVYANSVGKTYQNVFRMTNESIISSTDAKVGARIPAVWVNGGSNPFFHVCMTINGIPNYITNINFALNTWHKLKIEQRRNDDGNFVYEVALDNVTKRSVVNKDPKTFPNVKMFASDNLYQDFDGLLRNIKICQCGD